MPSKPANIRWINFRNDSGEEVPAYGIIRATEVSSGVIGDFIVADKPNTDTGAFRYFVNSGLAVPDGKFGKCSDATSPVRAATASLAGLGDELGPVDDSWELGDGSIFVVLDNVGPDIAYVTKLTGGGGGGESCPDRNEKHKLGINGTPTGGSLEIAQIIHSVPGTITIPYNSTNAQAKTAYETHPEVDQVTCTGGPLPGTEITIEFTGDAVKWQLIDPGEVNKSGLTGAVGIGAQLYRVTPGHPD